MDEIDPPTRSPRHYATPTRTRTLSPPLRQSGSTNTPKLGDFSRINPSFISPTSSPRPYADAEKSLSPRSRSAFSSPPRPRRGSQSLFSRDQPVSLGNFSKLLAILQPPPQLPSTSKDSTRAIAEVYESKSHTITSPRITILKRDATEVTTQASPVPSLPSPTLPNAVAADVKASHAITSPVLSAQADQSSSPSEFDSTSESETSDYDGTTATSLASSPSQHLPQRKASVSESWNSLNKKRETTDALFNQQLSAPTPLFPRNITTPPTITLNDTRTKAQKHRGLALKLARHFINDSLTQAQFRTADANAVHVFLDHSNINISFRRALQAKYANNDFSARFTPAPEFNLEFFSEILLRGRHVRILNAGCSTRPDHPKPAFVDELHRLGYHVDVRVRKPVVGDSQGSHSKTPSSSKHPRKRKTAAVPAPQNSDDTRYVEDLVDETLQTRIGESVMEYFQEQGTLVLATGDGKPAKYSDGFFAYADRALRMGWNVELVSWKLGLSSSWIDPEWTKKWGARFRLIELDEFLDDLWVPAT